MEAPMRPPFFMDKLSPQERTSIKRWYACGAGTYSAMLLLVVAMVALRSGPAQSHMTRHALGGTAVAAKQTARAACAARDLKLVMLIEELGEALALPGQTLADAFFTMVKARELCRDGRVAEALAIYDGIAIAPAQASAK
jgi:hypothetical protein